ncbi:unnamed protein product [Sphagnum balticum]
MSVSLKAVVPAQVKMKKLFNTQRIEDLHIYAISFFVVEDYLVELKPARYNGVSQTFYLKEFGAKMKEKDYVVCDSERQMLAQFLSERIATALAGRLLADTFVHSKDMMRSVDYELEAMAAHIRPEIAFKGLSDE